MMNRKAWISAFGIVLAISLGQSVIMADEVASAVDKPSEHLSMSIQYAVTRIELANFEYQTALRRLNDSDENDRRRIDARLKQLRDASAELSSVLDGRPLFQKEVTNIDARFVKSADTVAKKELDAARATNQQVKDAVPASEIRRLELVAELASLKAKLLERRRQRR